MKLLIGLLVESLVYAKVITSKGYKQTLSMIKQEPDFLAMSMVIGDECDDCFQALQVYERFAAKVDPIVKVAGVDRLT